MANQVTLMQFLQRDPRPVTFLDRKYSTSSTTNKKYGHAFVEAAPTWSDFNLSALRRDHGDVLDNVTIANDAHVETPPRPVGAEDGLRERVAVYVDRSVRRALTTTFQYLRRNQRMQGRTAVTLDVGSVGSSAVIVNDFVPDRAFYDEWSHAPVNRLPGEIKPNFRFESSWRNGTALQTRRFFTRLGQLSFYMLQQGKGQNHSGAKYGFMLSNTELIAFRKNANLGEMEVSHPVPWNTARAEGNPTGLTVFLALWYLGMLASQDNGWALPARPGDPSDRELENPPQVTTPRGPQSSTQSASQLLAQARFQGGSRPR